MCVVWKHCEQVLTADVLCYPLSAQPAYWKVVSWRFTSSRLNRLDVKRNNDAKMFWNILKPTVLPLQSQSRDIQVLDPYHWAHSVQDRITSLRRLGTWTLSSWTVCIEQRTRNPNLLFVSKESCHNHYIDINLSWLCNCVDIPIIIRTSLFVRCHARYLQYYYVITHCHVGVDSWFHAGGNGKRIHISCQYWIKHVYP